MKGSNSRVTVAENRNNNEEIEWEVRPGGMLVQKREDNEDDHLHGDGGPTIKVKVVHGSNQLDLFVPSQSTFGDLKRCIAQQTSLEPNQQRLLFRGKEKEDREHLHMAGVKDNAKVLLIQEPTRKERKHEEAKSIEMSSACPAVAEVKPEVANLEGTSKERKVEEVKSDKLSRACAAVAEVREEVDKLAEQVAALEVVVNGGTKVGEKDFVVLSELLMRQLLKLDSIEAEGEGKVQRKLQVRRVQSLVDKVDSLKARNSNPFSNNNKAVSVTTKWETFDSGMGSLSAPPPFPSSTEVTQDWERFD
ncbi:BAG family molecular chaperone regulator 4 isoform X2 [Camellia sinensis]|uniref:BAG family molecular chaperone regulator 4 isoform X2 n=1 Tax=Camellia sinensis TaxID=4442 RepID=UPI0010369F04|nr:BAG family molecular chaperone regulator 4 isoform X2 [Camellia sinensis]